MVNFPPCPAHCRDALERQLQRYDRPTYVLGRGQYWMGDRIETVTLLAVYDRLSVPFEASRGWYLVIEYCAKNRQYFHAPGFWVRTPPVESGPYLHAFREGRRLFFLANPSLEPPPSS